MRCLPPIGAAFAALILSAGCIVGSLPNEGRTCAQGAGCGEGTWCDPVEGRCVSKSPDSGIDIPDLLDLPDIPTGSDQDLTIPDADAEVVPLLQCSAPRPAVTNPHTANLWEVALQRTDGLTIVAMEQGVGWFQASRPDFDQPFDKWEATTVVPSGAQDPSFFIRDEKQWLIASVGEVGTRTFEVCKETTSCQAADVHVLDMDLDGPSVAAGGILMVFNAKSEMLKVAYQATPIDTELTQWNATHLTELDAAGEVDDPAISPDGTVIVFNSKKSLWVARRDAIGEAFSAPELLAAVNDPTGTDQEPELGQLPSGDLELLFHSDRDTPQRVYRSVCQTTAR